jgi:hypothetical protein
MNVHFHYAQLYTVSPVYLASSTIWNEMAQVHDGYQQLEKGRDEAYAVLEGICEVSSEGKSILISRRKLSAHLHIPLHFIVRTSPSPSSTLSSPALHSLP